MRTDRQADEPVLARVVRNGFVESVHRGSLVVLDREGNRLLSRGHPSVPVLPRSSLKPLQATAMVRLGLQLPSASLALVCASHSGEPGHASGVRVLLQSYGLEESALLNTPDYPVGEVDRARWLAQEQAPSRLVQNCSGKHAGMLATCVANGWPTQTYLTPSHPLQRQIAATIAELAAEDVAATAVDGCGAPAAAISLDGLARAFGRLAAAEPGTAEGSVADALRRHPELVGGTGRDVTVLLRDGTGLIAKDGAEAVYAVGLPDGTGVALKIADGGQRARPVVLGAVLHRLGLESPGVDHLRRAPVLGHGVPVGSVEAVGLDHDG